MYEFMNYQVRDVMSHPVSIGSEASLGEVERVLEKNGFNALPVVDTDDRLIGFVTTLDLLKAFAFNDESILPSYDDIMSRYPATVPPRQPLTRTLQKMIDSRNKSFPVVVDGRLVGIVAREDLMRALRRADAGERPGE
jgi:CBS domain-containing protein